MTASHVTTLAIVDPCCAAGYDTNALTSGGLGGTEATVLRVAQALGKSRRIVHFQQGRTSAGTCAAGAMQPLCEAYTAQDITTFVVINAWKVARKLRKAYPDARITLWLHNYPGRHNRPMAQALSDARVDIVCVSRTHAAALQEFLAGRPPVNISYIYNPLADHLAPDATPRDRNRLLYASSPHKGLSEVFTHFAAARAQMPDLTLAVADPGYLAWDTGPVPDGVQFLGTLPLHELIAQMRRSLCLFYPQVTFSETFGLVIAEANAVGLPVLAHRGRGANDEVVSDAAQLVDVRAPGQIVARLRDWQTRFPAVRGNPAFRLGTVAQAWAYYLDGNVDALPRRTQVA